jgi:outer membrane protein assembly factor BamB
MRITSGWWKPMARIAAIVWAGVALGWAAPARAEIRLEQIISREDPAFNCAKAALAVGRDGMVYLASGSHGSFVLRISPEGKDKLGAVLTDEAINFATANAQGVMASAHGHFSARVSLHDQHLEKTSDAPGFLVSDNVGWDAPADVQAGASGDFYGLDQHRDRVLRITANGKVVRELPIGHEPPGGGGQASMFRVSEKNQLLYVLSQDGTIRCIGFDGAFKWRLRAGISFNGWDGGSGGFDVDDEGILYLIGPGDENIKKFSSEGKPAGEVKLDMGEFKPRPEGLRISALQVRNGDVFIKRIHPTEMFQRYELSSGKLRNVVTTDHERFTVRYPSEIWMAGQDLDFTIDFDAGGRPVKPQWRVWLKTFGDTDYRPLKITGNKLEVPADLRGICQVKVSPEIQPLVRGLGSEYQVQGLVEVRQPGAQGSASAFTENNRVWFGRGEEIPFAVMVRSSTTAQSTDLKVSLMEGDRRLASGAATVPAGESTLKFLLPGWVTAALKPGRYAIVPSTPGLTCVSQALQIGPGMNDQPFRTIDYGDYGLTFPTKFGQTAWDAPDSVAAHLDWAQKLGFNFFVDRLGWNGNFSYFTRVGDSDPMDALAKRLQEDRLAVSPHKASESPQFLQMMAGYGARGVQEMPILLLMDAGLPLGEKYDDRKPEQMLADLQTVNQALKPYPAFTLWDWASNWWVNQRGSKAAKDAQEKAAYDDAVERANQTGEWNPVLDRVADQRWRQAVEAEDMFRRKMNSLDTFRKTTAAGPYRNVDAYPPVAFNNVDVVDLQAQFEQIDVPFHAPQSVDYYRRPGKSVLGHPEVWNDAGTGDLILPTLFQMVMRGSDSAGLSGNIPNWGAMPNDSRLSDCGMLSVYRALNGVLKEYGPWLTTLAGHDHAAIIVERRMCTIDSWPSVMPQHFSRLLEAYISCLHAHYPATYVFAEDIQPGTLDKFAAILLVDQRVELEPTLSRALEDARSKGAAIFCDGTCRKSLMPDGAQPLGVSFDNVEKDPEQCGDDAAYLRFAQYAIDNAKVITKSLAATGPPVAGSDNSEILMSERINESGRFLFVVNNTVPALDPGHIWRVTLTETCRVPLVAPIRLPEGAKVVYDVFAGRRVPVTDGVVQADLRSLPARIYAMLPAPVASVDLSGPKSVKAAQPFQVLTRVLDERANAIPTSVPLRLRLLAADGSVLEERCVSASHNGAVARFVAPLNAPSSQAVLEATELFSGKTAVLKLMIEPAAAVEISDQAAPAPAPQPASAENTALGQKSVPAWTPADTGFGPHIRDIAVAEDGKSILLNSMNWDQNLYCLDSRDGRLRWSRRVGQYFAFAPQAFAGGFAIQGFDFQQAEGYFLHLLDEKGQSRRRFALYGVPQRLPHRFVPSILKDQINNFAVPDNGKWVAAAGDLGLAVWSSKGKLLWSQDWWRTNRHTARLRALDPATLLAVEGLTATAYQATTGQQVWRLEDLAPNGEIRQSCASRDGKTIALLGTSLGGRVFLLRDGKLLRTIPTAADDADLSPDGANLAVVNGNQIKLYSAANGLQWIHNGDETMRQPRFSRDGQRIAATSDLGSAYVLDVAGHILFQQDEGAKATAAWFSNGDLLLGTWMGKVQRLDSQYIQKWSARLTTPIVDLRTNLLAEDPAPATRIAAWGNAEGETRPIRSNLLAETKPIIQFVPSGDWGGRAKFVQNPTLLYDGKAEPPPGPWLNWANVGFFAETSPINYVLIDSFRTLMRVNAVTLVEDPSHPESFLRDARLDYWSAAQEQWVTVMPLLSNQAVHTHKLPEPVEAARWRIMLPWGVYGNLRLGEIVFHGERLGCSHPDVAAQRPLAVLFDEGADLADSLIHDNNGLSFDQKHAYAGNRSLVLNIPRNAQNAEAAPRAREQFGHTIPNWDFEIAENPTPGQYRYLQFAWHGTPQTQGAALRLTTPSSDEVEIYAGANLAGTAINSRKAADEVPTDWQIVKVDLWDAFRQRPVRIQGLKLRCAGAAAWFDQIVLGRHERDLPTKR